MPPKPTQHVKVNRKDNVRIGPLSIITLITVICMAVLAVLAASTAHATSVISDRQATATQMMYANERAAQEFLASIDEALASVRASGGSTANGTQAVQRELDKACERARSAGGEDVECTASIEQTTVNAKFICNDTRQLNIAITIRSDATYRIEKWKMASAQQDASTGTTLWSGA